MMWIIGFLFALCIILSVQLYCKTMALRAAIDMLNEIKKMIENEKQRDE